MLPRLHLFEWEDQPWFPAIIRDLATDYLHHVERKFALHRPVVGLLSEALKATGQTHVVDLCAGGGGPMLPLQKELAEAGVPITVTLTDRFPNREAFAAMETQSNGAIRSVSDSVDALHVPHELRGFRTMFNAFHHFKPTDAVQVLRDAAQARQPIGIFEVPERRWSTLIPFMLLLPLMVALMTPFIRPFRWSRLLFTYVVPLVPLTCCWDGLVSQLRAYTSEEMESLGQQTGVEGYVWKAGQVPIGTVPGRLTYLIGRPV